MTDNKLLSKRTQRYEVKASNGQVLEHGITKDGTIILTKRQVK